MTETITSSTGAVTNTQQTTTTTASPTGGEQTTVVTTAIQSDGTTTVTTEVTTDGQITSQTSRTTTPNGETSTTTLNQDGTLTTTFSTRFTTPAGITSASNPHNYSNSTPGIPQANFSSTAIPAVNEASAVNYVAIVAALAVGAGAVALGVIFRDRIASVLGITERRAVERVLRTRTNTTDLEKLIQAGIVHEGTIITPENQDLIREKQELANYMKNADIPLNSHNFRVAGMLVRDKSGVSHASINEQLSNSNRHNNRPSKTKYRKHHAAILSIFESPEAFIRALKKYNNNISFIGANGGEDPERRQTRRVLHLRDSEGHVFNFTSEAADPLLGSTNPATYNENTRTTINPMYQETNFSEPEDSSQSNEDVNPDEVIINMPQFYAISDNLQASRQNTFLPDQAEEENENDALVDEYFTGIAKLRGDLKSENSAAVAASDHTLVHGPQYEDFTGGGGPYAALEDGSGGFYSVGGGEGGAGGDSQYGRIPDFYSPLEAEKNPYSSSGSGGFYSVGVGAPEVIPGAVDDSSPNTFNAQAPALPLRRPSAVRANGVAVTNLENPNLTGNSHS